VIQVQIMRYNSEHLAHKINILWMVFLFECKVGCIRETSMMGREGTCEIYVNKTRNECTELKRNR